MVPLKIELPDGFLDEEVRCGYIVTREMKEVWAVELDLAAQLLDVCKRYNIKIFADSGTLLGAARHGGFIPWDDDMDFCMLRSEYEKFCKIAPQEFKEPYFFQTEHTDPGCLRGHAQIRNSQTTAILDIEKGKATFNQGIFIDVFPLDEVYDEENKFEKQKERVDHAQDMFRILNDYLYTKTKRNFLKLVWSKVADLLCSRSDWYKKFELGLQEANGNENKYVNLLCSHMVNNKWLRKRRAYDDVTTLNFENMRVPVVADYEDVLTDLYGDWRKFVKGISMHQGVFFDTSNSYKKYISGELKIPNDKM